MKRIISQFFILFVLFAMSCTERIDIRTQDAQSRIAIYGYITSDTTTHSIQITRSAGFFSAETPVNVSDASVTITDCQGEVFKLAEHDTIPGLYLTKPNVYAQEGRTYKLDVHLADGAHYQAEAYMQTTENRNIDSIDLKVSTLSGCLVEVLLYASDDADTKTFYSVFVSINDSILNSNIRNFMVMDNGMLKTGNLDGTLVYFLSQRPISEHNRRNEIIKKDDVITLNINAISGEYARFISNVQSEVSASIPIFSGPPADVPSNIKSPTNSPPALGFFTAFPKRYMQTVVKEELVNEIAEKCNPRR
jgi:hypothetical protein